MHPTDSGRAVRIGPHISKKSLGAGYVIKKFCYKGDTK